MTIITQDGTLANYDKVKYIAAVGGTVGDSDVFAVFAFDDICKYGNMEEYHFDYYSDGVFQLGVYNTQSECEDVINKIIAAIANDSRIFQMPETEYMSGNI